LFFAVGFFWMMALARCIGKKAEQA
jgi:hypothetical protein